MPEVLCSNADGGRRRCSCSVCSQDCKKWSSCIAFTIQNATFAALLRYTRVRPSKTPRYATSTLVVFGEGIKALLSSLFLAMDVGFGQAWHQVRSALFANPSETGLLAVPAACYAVSNNLSMLAANFLTVTTFQILWQMRILATAFFARVVLGKVLSCEQWVALALLTSGVYLAQTSQQGAHQPSSAAVEDQIEGVIAMVLSSALAGFSGVFMEKILKSDDARHRSLWLRNLQLSLLSLPMTLAVYYAVDSKATGELGFFHGYDVWVWLTAISQGMAGLLVACVIKYAGSIARGFASSSGVLFALVVDWAVFAEPVGPSLSISAVLVTAAVLLYSKACAATRCCCVRFMGDPISVDGSEVVDEVTTSGSERRKSADFG